MATCLRYCLNPQVISFTARRRSGLVVVCENLSVVTVSSRVAWSTAARWAETGSRTSALWGGQSTRRTAHPNTCCSDTCEITINSTSLLGHHLGRIHIYFSLPNRAFLQLSAVECRAGLWSLYSVCCAPSRSIFNLPRQRSVFLNKPNRSLAVFVFVSFLLLVFKSFFLRNFFCRNPSHELSMLLLSYQRLTFY